MASSLGIARFALPSRLAIYSQKTKKGDFRPPLLTTLHGWLSPEKEKKSPFFVAFENKLYLDNTLNYISLKALPVDNLRIDRCVDFYLSP